MTLYENSAEVVREEDSHGQIGHHQTTYEEPIQVYAPNSDSMYSSLGNTSTLRSCKNTTFPSTAGERHYEKASKIRTTSRYLKACLVILSVGTVIAMGVASASLALYFKVSENFKATNFYISTTVGDLSARITKLEDLENEKNRKFTESLRIYEWYQASNKLWYKLFRSRVSYRKAKSNCEALNTSLVASGIQNSTVREEILSNVVDKDISWFWIGLDNWRTMSTWVWSNGVEWDKNSTMWGKQSLFTNQATVQRCGLFFSKLQSIRPRQCTRQFSYLCETPGKLFQRSSH